MVKASAISVSIFSIEVELGFLIKLSLTAGGIVLVAGAWAKSWVDKKIKRTKATTGLFFTSNYSLKFCLTRIAKFSKNDNIHWKKKRQKGLHAKPKLKQNPLMENPTFKFQGSNYC
jgi:hypothetical protein